MRFLTKLFGNSEKELKPKENSGYSGYIGYYGLEDWWLTEFSDAEREYIENKYQPMGSSPGDKSLTHKKIEWTSASAANFLNGLSSWFTGQNDRDIARKMLDKAQKLTIRTGSLKNVLDEHFVLSEQIPIYYRDRNQEGMLEKAIEVCKRQIELANFAREAFLKECPKQSLPSHRGYKQMVIILDKEGRRGEAISLCMQAKNEGWSGNWDKRIARYMKVKGKQI